MARYFNVPIVAETPAGFPPLTLSVMRTICAIGQATGQPQTSPAAQEAIIRALDAFYAAFWGQGRDITDKGVQSDVLGQIVRSSEGKTDVGRIAELVGTEGKRILLENTELALSEGAFGLPWMVCENEKGERDGFWGCDHLGLVLDFLGIEKPRAGGWKAML